MDKTLRELNPEHGNSEAHALETYDDNENDLLKGHAERDEEDCIKYQHRRTGVVEDEEEGGYRYAERHEDEEGEVHDEAGDVWIDRNEAAQEAQFLAYKLTDEEALEEKLQDLRAEETEAEIHKAEPDVLAEIDLDRVGRQVDISALEFMEK